MIMSMILLTAIIHIFTIINILLYLFIKNTYNRET